MAEKKYTNIFTRYFIDPVRKNPLSALFFLLIISFLLYQRLPMFLSEVEMEGKPAPDFQLRGIDGKQVRLSDLKGKKVAINFWATWCPPCRIEIPILNDLYDEISDESSFRLIGISGESENTVNNFTASNPIHYTVLLDEDDSVARSYRIMAYPTFVYINEDGIITDIDSGMNFFLKWKIRFMATGSIF